MCIGSWGLSLSSTRVGGGSCTHGDESIEERCERLVGMAMCVVRHVWGESHELAHAEHKLRATDSEKRQHACLSKSLQRSLRFEPCEVKSYQEVKSSQASRRHLPSRHTPPSRSVCALWSHPAHAQPFARFYVAI